MKRKVKDYLKLLKKTTKEIEKLSFHKLDNNVKLLKKAFEIAYKNDIFALYKSDDNVQDKLKLRLFSKLTKYSGSLSFLAIQILAANSIMRKNDFSKKEKYLNKKCGIAINHLRANNTVVCAKKSKNGYKLNGTLTWASGYKIFDNLLIGFHFEGKEYEVIAKFKEAKGFNILEAPETFVGLSLNTVNIKLKDFFVEEENIVSSNILGNYTKIKSLSKTVHYALFSLGLGAIEYIEDEDLKFTSKKRLMKLKKEFLKTNDGRKLDEQRILLFNLVQKIVTIGMIKNGGKSILVEKNLQRYYRELIMFNSNGLNQDIKELFLDEFIIGGNKVYA